MIITIVFVVSCNPSYEEQIKQANEEDTLKCEEVRGMDPRMMRCENEEVKCYTVGGYRGSLDCKWK